MDILYLYGEEEMKTDSSAIDRYAQDMSHTIWNNIETAVKSQRVVIKSFCEQAGMSESVYFKHCRCAKTKKPMPDTAIDSLDKICSALGRSISYFMGKQS